MHDCDRYLFRIHKYFIFAHDFNVTFLLKFADFCKGNICVWEVISFRDYLWEDREILAQEIIAKE